MNMRILRRPGMYIAAHACPLDVCCGRGGLPLSSTPAPIERLCDCPAGETRRRLDAGEDVWVEWPECSRCRTRPAIAGRSFCSRCCWHESVDLWGWCRDCKRRPSDRHTSPALWRDPHEERPGPSSDYEPDEYEPNYDDDYEDRSI
jgi:hypothetical protein